MKGPAAIYARVSFRTKQKGGENTIASQNGGRWLLFAREQQFEVPREWVFEDDGYSGGEGLIRPGWRRR